MHTLEKILVERTTRWRVTSKKPRKKKKGNQEIWGLVWSK